jgi:hypothetical protein
VTEKSKWPNPRLQRTPSAPLSRQPLGVPKPLPALLVLVILAWAAQPSQTARGSQPVIDPHPKSVRELFRRSDAVAVVWLTAGLPEGIGGPWHVVRARVNWAFKGAQNNGFIFFRCFEECTLGEQYIVFLRREGHTLGQLEKLDRHVPLAPFPSEAEYFVPTSGHGFAYPVFVEPRLGRKDSVVGFIKAESDLPAVIAQGSLAPCVRHWFDWWASYEQLKGYLIELAQDADGRHP